MGFWSKPKQTTTPLEEIGLAIVRASYACSQKMKPALNVADEKGKLQAEFVVFCEFIYFFMHLTMRSASSKMSEQQLEQLQGYLGPSLSSAVVDSFVAHWPEKLKVKIRSEFYDKLNSAEREYSTSKELMSKENSLTGDSLLSKLGRNVADLSGHSMNPAIITLVISLAGDAYIGMKLESLVQEASKVLKQDTPRAEQVWRALPTVTPCPKCSQKLRVPSGKHLNVTCTACRHQFLFQS